MGKRILLFMTIAILSSCNKEDDGNPESELTGNWKLIEMSGSIPNSETTGSDMEWQENYLLNTNGTFLKSRERDGITTEESGNFMFEELSDGKYLMLTYATDNEIIGNCTSELTEVLRLRSDSTLFGTWSACDGPGLVYEKTD